ncbi:hypothetical protein MKX03_001787, partial [Papaver bracteatum]
MIDQIESLKDAHAGEMDNLKSKHTQEIKELKTKHSHEMGNLLLKQEELEHSLAEATTLNTLFDRKMESLVVHLYSKQAKVDKLLSNGGNVAKFMAEQSCEYLRTIFPDEYKSSPLSDEINNILDEGMEGMQSGGMNKNDVMDEGIQEVPGAAIVFPVLNVDNPSTEVDTLDNQENILDTMAEEELPSFTTDIAGVPLSMDECLNL